MLVLGMLLGLQAVYNTVVTVCVFFTLLYYRRIMLYTWYIAVRYRKLCRLFLVPHARSLFVTQYQGRVLTIHAIPEGGTVGYRD